MEHWRIRVNAVVASLPTYQGTFHEDAAPIASSPLTSAASPVPTELLDTMKEKEHGRPYDHALFDQQVRDAVADRVRHQVENGIDIVTDGEMSKVSFIGYVKDRLGGFEVEEGGSGAAPSWQVEIDMFPEYYADYMGKYSAAVDAPAPDHLPGPGQLRRPRPPDNRHRQPQGGGRRRRG